MSDTNETIADIIAEMRGIHVREFQDYADRLEAAHRREREAITPKSDPDWKDICAKCKDGDIEPNYCKYYGEPNGCNSPIYGEHPTAEKSSVVGDCAKLREALENVAKQLTDATEDENFGEDVMYLVGCMRTMLQKCRAALAAPARNCDRFASAEEAWDAYDEWVESYRSKGKTPPLNEFGWLFAPYEEGGANG